MKDFEDPDEVTMLGQEYREVLWNLPYYRELAEHDKDVAFRSGYRGLIRNLLIQIQDKRQDPTITSLESGERIERSVLHELKQPGSRQRLGVDLFNEAVALLRDHNARDEARRVAIATFFVDVQSDRTEIAFLNHTNYDYSVLHSDARSIVSRASRAKLNPYRVYCLWQIVNAKSDGETKTAHRAADAWWSVDENTLWNRLDDADPKYLSKESHGYRSFGEQFIRIIRGLKHDYIDFSRPGMLWRGEWESMASKLEFASATSSSSEE